MHADPFQLVGTTVADRYAVEEVIGEGGFSVVYRAMHLVWKRPVAIKAFKGNTSLPQRERERLLEGFFQEGALLAELSERSTAVCQARDTSTLETSTGEWVPYIVLEWLDGETLEDVLGKERQRKAAPRSITAAMKLLQPVVEALDYAHSRNIAHLDMKPANLFVLGAPRSDDCVVKILDFGIAKVLSDARKSIDSIHGHTNVETTMFTPRYGAPEQFSRSFGPTGPWTDVFAIALILVELITGKPPLRGETVAQLGRNATSRKRRPTPRTHGVLITDRVEQVFATALAVEPLERYLSAGDFWNALELALGLEPHIARHEVATSIAPPPLVPQEPRELVTHLSFTLPRETVAPPRLRRARRRPEDRRRLAIGVTLLSVGGLLGVVAPRAVPIAARVVSEESPVKVAGAEPLANTNVASALARARTTETKCPSGMVLVEPSIGVNAFCIDEHEVTTEDYMACVASGLCPKPDPTNAWSAMTAREKKSLDPLCNARDPEERGKRPMNCLERESARVFCATREARLPTQGEWHRGVHVADAGQAHVQSENGEWVEDALVGSIGEGERASPTRSHLVGFRCAR
jgi:serine/threonine protein kinase